MKKVQTLTAKNVYINTNGLRTAEAFKSKTKEEFYISLNYGLKNDKGERVSDLVGPFGSLEQAEQIIESLM